MTTSTITAESDAYLAAVREQLDDLPEEERTDLLEDLAQHLADISANRAENGPGLTALLGLPAQYAADLRAAADLPPRVAPPVTATKESLTMRLGRSFPARAGMAAWRQPLIVKTRQFLPELRPAWWVLRGYLLIAIPALWDPDSSDDFPIPTVGGSHAAGLVFTVLAIAASVALGNRVLGKGRWLVIAGNAFLVISGLSLLSNLEYRMDQGPGYVNFSSPSPDYPLASPHGPVSNIFPYAADGTPMENVLLFDQDGRPLRTAMQQWWADGCDRVVTHPQAEDGVGVEFAYPKGYVLTENNSGLACQVEGYKPVVPLPTFGQKPGSSIEMVPEFAEGKVPFGPFSGPPLIERDRPFPGLFNSQTEGEIAPPPSLDPVPAVPVPAPIG